MSEPVTIAVEIELELLDRVDALAVEHGRTRTELVEYALQRLVKTHDDLREALREAMDDIDAGRLLAHEEVFETIDAHRTARNAA